MATQQDNKKYEYFAFISYKREDEKWAKRLQNKIEAYNLPSALRKERPELPAKISPIFRDKSELAGGNLKDEIEKGLSSSKYLIVICSPRSARSPWVSSEVQWFIDNGRENDIIPFIIGGLPNATNPEEECFPEGLRKLSGDKEILGINIDEMGQDAAIIKVVARMFDLKFDSLWQRHERKRKQKIIRWSVLGILFLTTSLVITGKMTMLKIEASNQTVIANRQLAIANRQTAIANKERNEAQKARNEAIAARDSLLYANYMIEQQKDTIIQSKIELIHKNNQLTSYYINEELNKANNLINAGNQYAAYDILNTLIRNNDNRYISEICDVLRKIEVFSSADEGKSLGVIHTYTKLNALSVSKDGRYTAAASSSGLINIYINKNGQIKKSFNLSGSQINQMIFSYNNELIIASANGDIHTYNIAKDTLYKLPISHNGELRGLCTLNVFNNVLSALSSRGYLLKFDMQDQKYDIIQTEIANGYMRGCFSYDSQKLVVLLYNPKRLSDGTLYEIDLTNIKGIDINKIQQGIPNSDIKFDSNGELYYFNSPDKGIVSRMFGQNDSDNVLIQNMYDPLCFEIVSSNQFLRGTFNGDIEIHTIPKMTKSFVSDIYKTASMQILHGHTDKVKLMSYNSEQGILASYSDDKTIRIWNFKQCYTDLAASPYTRISLDFVWGNRYFTSDGHFLYKFEKDSLRLLNCITKEERIFALKGQSVVYDWHIWLNHSAAKIGGLYHNSKNNTLSIMLLRNNIFDIVSSVNLGKVHDPLKIAFSPDCNRILIEFDNSLCIYNKHLSLLKKITKKQKIRNHIIKISNDGKVLLYDSNSLELSLYQQDSSIMKNFKFSLAHNEKITDISFVRNSNNILVSTWNTRYSRILIVDIERKSLYESEVKIPNKIENLNEYYSPNSETQYDCVFLTCKGVYYYKFQPIKKILQNFNIE